jgi:trans-aconitate 2-methyltransferase
MMRENATPRSDWDGARYDRLADPQAKWGRTVVGRLELSGAEIVLDAGCGSGRVTEELLRRLPEGRVIALDASESMLEQARKRLASANGRVRFVRADLLELGPDLLGADAPVDGVFSTATFHWITDHDWLFRNIAGVLRPGGQLVAQCGGKGNLDRLLRIVRSLGAKRAGTWLYASPDETSARLRNAGFVDVRVWSHPESTPFPSSASLADFLEAVCLREHLATLPPDGRRPFTERVAAALPEPVIDYVRLNITARRAA